MLDDEREFELRTFAGEREVLSSDVGSPSTSQRRRLSSSR